MAEAERWLRRVRNWVENLAADLRADAIKALGDAERRWLFILVRWNDKWPSSLESSRVGAVGISFALCPRAHLQDTRKFPCPNLTSTRLVGRSFA